MSGYLQSQKLAQWKREALCRADLNRKQAEAIHALELEAKFRKVDIKPSFPPDPKFKIDLRSHDTVLCSLLNCEWDAR